jgi:hypothetical protein
MAFPTSSLSLSLSQMLRHLTNNERRRKKKKKSTLRVDLEWEEYMFQRWAKWHKNPFMLHAQRFASTPQHHHSTLTLPYITPIHFTEERERQWAKNSFN